MSTSSSPSQPANIAATPGGAVDPSMEDILASIRRILSEDEAEQPVAATAAPAGIQVHDATRRHEPDEVFALDASMLVDAPSAAVAPHPQQPQPLAEPAPSPVMPANTAVAGVTPESLVAPETAAAAATSVGALLRSLVAEREQIAVYRGGPTIEDMVREEIRPLLKAWLDTNLPPIVERLVRTELERVVGRAVT